MRRKKAYNLGKGKLHKKSKKYYHQETMIKESSKRGPVNQFNELVHSVALSTTYNNPKLELSF